MKLPNLSKYLLAVPVVVGGVLLALSASIPARRPDGRAPNNITGNLTVSGGVSIGGSIAFTGADATKVLGTINTDINGNGSATVYDNSLCLCSAKNNPVNVCARSGTTLTVQASASGDQVTYFCPL